jgi:hypothetical protein
MVLNIKFLLMMKHELLMYNHSMKQQTRKRISTICLVLGLAFLTIAFVTNQTAFSWIAIVFVMISLVMGGKWMRPRR